jgi:hypothetical protein
MDKADIESTNGNFRDECSTPHWFVNLRDTEEQIEARRLHHNTGRPNSALANETADWFAGSAAGPEAGAGPNPGHSHYPCVGNWGQVTVGKVTHTRYVRTPGFAGKGTS